MRETEFWLIPKVCCDVFGAPRHPPTAPGAASALRDSSQYIKPPGRLEAITITQYFINSLVRNTLKNSAEVRTVPEIFSICTYLVSGTDPHARTHVQMQPTSTRCSALTGLPGRCAGAGIKSRFCCRQWIFYLWTQQQLTALDALLKTTASRASHACGNEASPGAAHQPRKQLETDTVLGCVCWLISIYPKCSPAPSQSGFCAEELFIAFINRTNSRTTSPSFPH